MSKSLANLFQRMTVGVYVIGVAHQDMRNAFTAVFLMQVSFDPPLLALSINPRHSSYALLKRSSAFSVNVLKKGQLALAAHFGQPASVKKLDKVNWTPGHTGVPLLNESLAWFECKAESEYPAGDHMLVIGKVIDAKLLDAVADPLLYRDAGDMDGADTLFPPALTKPE